MNSFVICGVLVAGCVLAICQAGPAVDHESGSLSNSVRNTNLNFETSNATIIFLL